MLTFTLVGVDIHFVVYIYNYWCKFTPNCVELHLQVSRCSTWATVNLGTQELGPPGNLGQVIFRGPKVPCCFCRSLIKVKFSTDQFRPALGSGCCSIVTMLKKPQNCPISDFFDLTPKYFLPLLPYTDLVPPSTDPVPPSTNQYRSILTQYHQWSKSLPYTDPLPPSTNK